MADLTMEDRATTVHPDDAAARLGISRGTLDNWRWKGGGPRHIRVGGRVRYRLADIAEWLDGQARTSTSDRGPGA